MCSIYLQNFPYRWEEEDLVNICNPYGQVVDQHICRSVGLFRSSRGYGFIRFQQQTEAARAIAFLDGSVHDGRRLTVRWANGRNQNRIVAPLQAVQVPAVRVPAVRVPAVRVPAVRVPAVGVPAVGVPAVRVPAVGVPAVELNKSPVGKALKIVGSIICLLVIVLLIYSMTRTNYRSELPLTNLDNSLAQSSSSLNSLTSDSTSTLRGDQSDRQAQSREVINNQDSGRYSSSDKGYESSSSKSSEKIVPMSHVIGVQTAEVDREKATPTFFIKPVNKDGIGIKEADRFEDKGDQSLNLSTCEILSMDWQNVEKCNSYVLVRSKELEAEEVDKNMAAASNLNKPSLHQCLELFTEPEVLSPEEAWGLDMSPFCQGLKASDQRPIYDLYGVAKQHGHVGNCTPYVRLSTDGRPGSSEIGWCLCDDSCVTPIASEKSVVTADSYILFYRGRGCQAVIGIPPSLSSASSRSDMDTALGAAPSPYAIPDDERNGNIVFPTQNSTRLKESINNTLMQDLNKGESSGRASFEAMNIENMSRAQEAYSTDPLSIMTHYTSSSSVSLKRLQVPVYSNLSEKSDIEKENVSQMCVCLYLIIFSILFFFLFSHVIELMNQCAD